MMGIIMEKTQLELARKNTATILREKGIDVSEENLDIETFHFLLAKKFEKEVGVFCNLFEDEEDEKAIKKLADIEELLLTLVKEIGVEESDFQRIRHSLNEKFGNYDAKNAIKLNLDIN